jgi:outer membrane protein OmpA-like peptidoglycan-associated protein
MMPRCLAGTLVLVVSLSASGVSKAGAERLHQNSVQFKSGVAAVKPTETFVIGPSPVRQRMTLDLPPTRPRLAVRFTEQNEDGAVGTSPLNSDKKQPPAALASADSETANLPCELPTIRFRWASTWVSPKQGRALLDALAACRAERVIVTGYTCDLGSQPVNDRMALGRAKEVANLLTAAGYRVLDIKGVGKNQYVAVNPEHRDQNRRVEVTLAEP